MTLLNYIWQVSVQHSMYVNNPVPWPSIQYVFFTIPFQKYLHESRHRHAMARKRGDGGRFFSPKEKEEMAMQALKVSEGLELSSHWPATSAPPLG